MNSKKIKLIKSYLGILLGCTSMAAGFAFFINPYHIVPGGVYGASIVLHSLFPSIQVGTFGYMFDIPLLILSVLLLGGRIGGRTVFAALVTPLIMNGLSLLAYPTKEALRALDPSLIFDGNLDMSNHLMLTVIIGAILIGIGSGVIVNCGATSGGTDIVGMIMQKYAHIRFSNAIMMVDGAVVLFGLIVFSIEFTGGKGTGEEHNAFFLSLYSLIAIFVSAKTVARVINGNKDDKMIIVISNKDLEELRDFIIKDLDRTATSLPGTGIYTRQQKQILLIVVSYKEVQSIKLKIKQADPSAFVIVTDVYDTYGEGWKTLPNMSDIQPE